MTDIQRKHPLAECEDCPLFETGQFVPSHGPDKADIVIVGEAPGATEAKDGVPFSGDSGKLLNMVLKHHGIERDNCFVTNTVLCRPPGNDNPSTQAVRACADRLQTEILNRQPTRILTLGNFASRAILGTRDGITSLRVGPPKRSERFPGVAIVPTFHTAASLYNPGSFPDIVTDIGKLAGTYVVPSWSPPEFVVYDTVPKAKSFLAQLLGSNAIEIAVDIEIGVEKDLEFEHADQYRLLAVGLCWEPSTAHVLAEEPMQDPTVTAMLGRLVEIKRMVCHNGKFDLQGLLKYGHGRLYFDTMLASYAMDERRGIHSLEYQSIERLGSPTWKHEIARYLGGTKDFTKIPRPVLYRYNAYDVANTFRLYLWFKENMAPDLRALHDHQVEVSNVMQYVERNGVAVDVPYLETLEEHYQELTARLKSELCRIAEEPGYNPNSWQQVTRVLKDQFKRRVKNTRKETIDSLMESAARSGDKTLYDFCKKHLQFKREAKAYGTYVKGPRIRLRGGRIYPTYMLHGTTTGRSSCRNPNLQNVTRGSVLRKLYIPGSDSAVLMQADYRQVEFRVICALAREPYLRDIFLDSSRNIHEEVGRNYYGPNFSKEDDYEKYVRAKAVVFGLSYGREAYSLAAEFNISEAEAQAQIDAFFAIIPQVVKWRDAVQSSVLNLEDLVSPYGQHRRFHLITPRGRRDMLKEALAFYPQNIAAHTTFASAVEMVRRDPKFRDMLRINVHDSWVLEVEKSDVEEVSRFVSQTMEETARERFSDYVPFPVDVGIGPSWGEITDTSEEDPMLVSEDDE